jgi:hypothetical protein
MVFPKEGEGGRRGFCGKAGKRRCYKITQKNRSRKT